MDFTLIKIGTSAGIKLEEYKGSLSIIIGYEDKEGNFKQNWAEFEVYNKETKQRVVKKMPVRVYLGSQTRAIEVLKSLLEQLSGEEPPF